MGRRITRKGEAIGYDRENIVETDKRYRERLEKADESYECQGLKLPY